MYGHDNQRTNFNPDETTLSASNVNQWVSRWQVNLGSTHTSTASSSGPSISGGRAFLGSNTSSGPNFFSVDAVSGTVVWSDILTFTSRCFNVGIGSTPAISGTLLSVGGSDSAFYGIDATNGHILWRNPMNAGSSAFAWESPLLANGRSYLGVASDCDNPSVRGEVRAVDMNNGSQMANQYFVPAGQAGAGVWNSPALSPDGTKLFAGTGEDYGGYNGPYNRAMVSLDPITLQILDSFQEGALGQDLDFGTTPVVFHDSQGRTLVGANHKNGIFYAFDINSIGAGPVWMKSTGTTVGMMPAYDPTFGSGGTLFIVGTTTNNNSTLYAVDPATGNDLWPHVTPGGPLHGNMAIADGLIFINTGSSGLKILSESNGSTLRTIVPANAGSSNSGVAVSNGFVYWAANNYLNAWSLPATTPTPTATYTGTPAATATPTSVAFLVGHVTWQGRPAQPDPLQQLPVTLTLKSGSTEVNYPSQNTDAGGNFTVTVSGLAPGPYNWRVKGPKYLANAGAVALPGSGTTSAEMGLMRAGDANNDNVVNISDFNILKSAVGQVCGNPSYDDRADFNGDCVVNVTDFNLLRNNFGQSGALLLASSP